MKRFLLFIGLWALVSSCVSQAPENNGNKERLVYFSFDHHNSMSQCGEKYAVSMMEDGRVRVVIDEGFPEEKEFYLDDRSIFDELLVIVKSYKMDKYKESYSPRMEIFDGDNWSLNYQYDTKRSVRSGGYMAWPDNYREARHAISDYFKKWRDYQTGVLEIDYFEFTCTNNQGCDLAYSLQRGDEMATVILRDAQRGVDKRLQVDNAYMKKFNQMANSVRLKDKVYDYVTDDAEATRCTYFVRYNTGDTISGITCYTQYPSNKVTAILEFFNRWVEQ